MPDSQFPSFTPIYCLSTLRAGGIDFRNLKYLPCRGGEDEPLALPRSNGRGSQVEFGRTNLFWDNWKFLTRDAC